ncbi:MAG TPA: GH3 auxin-responsive promoter family protein [Pyrinomonadaceae bacterium]|nr:GH3 auxin-responsive promoter family protein [Pyrinomonadaceae bacterium]
MRALINDSLRFSIGAAIRALGAVVTVVHRLRICFFSYNQNRLVRKYKISDQTPVRSYGKELEALVRDAASSKRDVVRFAMTSGSTGTPKRVLFTRKRLRALKLVFSDFYVRSCWAFWIKRTTLYVFSSFSEDESLTSMLLEETRLPSYFSTLQAPYRVQCHPAVRKLRLKYGDTAVRLWVLTLSNPGVLYSTNPSTVSTFFDELRSNWEFCSKLIRDWWHDCEAFDPDVRHIAHRITSRGSTERLAAIAGSINAQSIDTYAPAVTSYICWTGGYVKAFLERLEKYLPADRYRLIPMYSMSTETVETIADFRSESVSFLPNAPGVLYEFREKGDVRLLKPHQLEPGHAYSLIVSDNYGLLRYDTGDVFLCRKRVGNLPDLLFQCRRNLEYSFTGEKLTADQVTAAFENTISLDGNRLSDQFLTCIPSQPDSDPVPHYKVVVVTDGSGVVQQSLGNLSKTCDRFFADLNCEYKAKRDSGRLGPVRSVTMTRWDFLKLTTGGKSESWEGQFKFLPLYVQTWEAMTRMRDEG